MAVEQEKVTAFRETTSPETVIREINFGWCPNLALFFDKYPIFAIREAILRYWLDRSVEVREQEADWIETRIHDLIKEEGETHSGFWKKLLGWYVFNSRGVLVNRALDFAIGITKMGLLRGFFYRSDILKIIAGRLDRSPEIYQEITTPALKLFLESFLQPDYTIYDWMIVDIKRVVRCAISVEDWRFLPLIEKVLFNLRNQKKPERYDFKKEIEILESLVFLKEAVRLFEEKQKEISA